MENNDPIVFKTTINNQPTLNASTFCASHSSNLMQLVFSMGEAYYEERFDPAEDMLETVMLPSVLSKVICAHLL